MGTLGHYHGMGGCYWRQFYFIRPGGTRILPRYALLIGPHHLLTSESAKSMSLGLDFYICVMDVPSGSETLLWR